MEAIVLACSFECCCALLLLLRPTADDLRRARPATFDLGVALPPLAASWCRPFPWVRGAPRAQAGRLRGCASHLCHFGSSIMLRDSPSTITPGDHGSLKFHYRRHGSDKFASTTTSHDDLVPLPLTKTCAPQASSSTTVDREGFGVIKYLSEANVNDYRRKNGTGKSEDPKYLDTDDMNVYGNSCNDKYVPLPSPRSREPLPSTLERARTTTSTTVA
ncbi:unnamed protein product [Triticum turgidum subsp. durum]|uniref:Uncharacterized protein n=1 Tax=Triticum turgidum subsp. durum TaxID=4567 RepID=A0A9R1R5N7_TRITD|nr:unnamed protein product [Triticum turgidum subsp. durum]